MKNLPTTTSNKSNATVAMATSILMGALRIPTNLVLGTTATAVGMGAELVSSLDKSSGGFLTELATKPVTKTIQDNFKAGQTMVQISNASLKAMFTTSIKVEETK